MPFNFANFFNNEVQVTIQIGDPPLHQPLFIHLKLNDKLSIIRKQLEKDDIIHGTLLFSKKHLNNENEFTKIAFEDEKKILLNDILDKSQNILYLTELKPSWKFLNDKCKLDYGRTVSNGGIKRAIKRAFIMKDCEMAEIGAEDHRKETIEFSSNEDRIMKTELSFTGDTDRQDFVKFGLSVNENSKFETNSICDFTEFGKVSLKFSKYLEPTPEFIKMVENAIKSENSKEEFKNITRRYGQFISTEVILGGSAYGKNTKESSEDENTSYECFKLIGGEQPDDLKDFDEKAWIKSLNYFRNWGCIRFQNPISIFQILPDDLRKQAISSLGKRIIHSNIEYFNYDLEEFGRPKVFELNISSNILKIIQNKDADCNFFATVVDTEETNDVFNCQILCPPERKPSLVIHCIQEEFRKRKCKLKIGWLVIGYCNNFIPDFNVHLNVLRHDFISSNNQVIFKAEFKYNSYNSSNRVFPPCIGIPVLSELDPSNDSIVIGHHFFNVQEENKIGFCTFSYCLKNECYVNLPNFTFYTLVISNYSDPDAFGAIPFGQQLHINLSEYFNERSPKYIGLYSKEDDCGPVFLNQESKQIKIRYIDCQCQTCFICNNETLKVRKKEIECLIFDPYDSYDISTTQDLQDFKLLTIKPSRRRRIKPRGPAVKNQLTQQLKLNYGLFLNGYGIQRSEQYIYNLFNDDKSNISLYKGQPIVYTNVNDPADSTNLLNFNAEKNNFSKDLEPSDACINFPIAEITYDGPLDLHGKDELYGHFFARKTLVGGKLFIKDSNLATPTQIYLLKFYIIWAYNSAKHNTINPFNNSLPSLPSIETLDGEQLNTPETIADWMNDLYQKNAFDIISYDDLIPISRLKINSQSEEDFETLIERQPGVSNFKEKLSIEEWIGNVAHVKLVRWIKDFHFLQGLAIKKHFKMEISKKIAVNFVRIPDIKTSNKSYLEVIRPVTDVERFLLSNNIFSVNDISSFPFVNGIIKSNSLSYKDNTFLIKFEQYEILLNKDDIKPTEEFERTVEKALNSIKPLNVLQDVFNEYGHLFPLRIILGKSFKSILPNSSLLFDKIDIKSPTSESLKPYLNDLNISCLLTQKGNIIEENELSDLLQNLNNDLEIVELSNIISLYSILEENQQRKIDNILDDNYKIIMTGITDLKDLDNNNIEHYKRIKIEPSLEDKDYEVFGSIISKNSSILEEFLVKFRLYDLNGFSVMIKTSRSTDINIKECYVLWMIIGIPSKLSVFSPKNRDLQITYLKKSVTLKASEFSYYVELPFPLSRKCSISVNAYYSQTDEPINIKLVGWSEDRINFQILESIYNTSNMNISTISDCQHKICILHSDCKNFKIDHKEECSDYSDYINDEYSLDLIGYILSKENFNEEIRPFIMNE